MQTAAATSTLIQGSSPAITFNLKVELDDNRPIFLSGNFNKWALRDKKFLLQKVGEKEYQLAWPDDVVLPEKIEYKYLKGGWESVEIDRYGNRIENRQVNNPKGEICDLVSRWRIKGLSFNKKFLPILDVIREDYEIPQLGKKRRICALLPHDYEETDKDYPVLYLNDGQNLFDDEGAFGTWAADQKLAILAEYGFEDLIVITIDHGGKDRIAEYSPFFHWKWGHGEGKRYLNFITETLKPYIDKNYRTLSDRSNTGFGGSSMGGLISLYSGLKNPDIFGKLMVFSPSLWISPKIFLNAFNSAQNYPMDVYLYAGGSESATMLAHIEKMKETLNKHPEIEIKTSIDPLGQHNEFKWGQEFPKALEWLFFKK